MHPSPTGRILFLLAMSVTTLGTAYRTTGFEDIRAVQILLLMSAGLCAGVALSLFVQHLRAESAGTEER
jgi:uncharacterized protein YoaH (UPF0181 family)